MAEDWRKTLESLPAEHLREFARIALERDPDLAGELERIAQKVQQEKQAEQEQLVLEEKTWESEWNALIQEVNPQTIQALGELCDKLDAWGEKKNAQLGIKRRWRFACAFSRWFAERAEQMEKDPRAFGLAFDPDVWEDWDVESMESYGPANLAYRGADHWLENVHISLETVGLEVFQAFLYDSDVEEPFCRKVELTVVDEAWAMELIRSEEQRILQEEPETERGKKALAYIQEVYEMAKYATDEDDDDWDSEDEEDDEDWPDEDWDSEDEEEEDDDEDWDDWDDDEDESQENAAPKDGSSAAVEAEATAEPKTETPAERPEVAFAAEVEVEETPSLEDLPDVPELSLDEDEESWWEMFREGTEEQDLEEPQEIQRYCRWLLQLGKSRVQGFLRGELRLKAHWFTVILYEEAERLQDIVEELDLDDDELEEELPVGPEDVMKACAGWWRQILAETDNEVKPEMFEDILDICQGEWGSYAEEVLLQTKWGQEEQVELLDYLGNAIEDADYEDRRQQLLQKLTDAEKTISHYTGPITPGNASGELIQNWRRKLASLLEEADLDDYDGLGELAVNLEKTMEEKVRELVRRQDYLGAYQHVMELYLFEQRLEERLDTHEIQTYYDPEGEDSYFLDTWEECGEMIGAIACLASGEIRRGIFKDLFTMAKQFSKDLLVPLTQGPWNQEELHEVLEYLERRRTYEPSDELEEAIETLQDNIKDPEGFKESWEVEAILGMDLDEDEDEDDEDDIWEDEEDEAEGEDEAWREEHKEDDAGDGGKDESDSSEAGGVEKRSSDAKSYDYLFWDDHFEDLWMRRIQTEVEYADFDDPDGVEDFCTDAVSLLDRQISELQRKGCWRGAFCSCVVLYREANILQGDLERGALSPFSQEYRAEVPLDTEPSSVAEACVQRGEGILEEAPKDSLARILGEIPGMARDLKEDFRKVLREAPWTAEQKQVLLDALGERPKEAPAPKVQPAPKGETTPKGEAAPRVEDQAKTAEKPVSQKGKKKAVPKQSPQEVAARKRLADYRRSGLTQQYWEELRKLVLESAWATVEDVRMLKSMSPVRKWQGVLDELRSSPAWKDRQGELQEFLAK